MSGVMRYDAGVWNCMSAAMRYDARHGIVCLSCVVIGCMSIVCVSEKKL